jgi:hypothetical protein
VKDFVARSPNLLGPIDRGGEAAVRRLMKFARIVFLIAGVWGVTILTPLYFLFDFVGRSYPPPITHPDLYYGFVGVTLVWQVAFLMIAANPIRLRPVMLAAILEKVVYIATMVILYSRGQLQAGQVAVAVPDFVLMALFVAAFFRTPEQNESLPGRSVRL